MSPKSSLPRNTQPLLRHAIFLLAFLTYLFDPVDIVWRFAQTSTHPRGYERLGFASAATLLLIAALTTTMKPAFPASCTHSHWRFLQHRLPPMLFALAIATLLPLTGACLLVFGEALRLSFSPGTTGSAPRPLVYWAACFSMLCFSLTLRDRVADILFGATFLLAIAADAASSFRPSAPR